MTSYSSPFLSDELLKRTVIFGLRMWVIIGIGVGIAFVLLLFLISLWLISKRSPASGALHTKVIRATSNSSMSREIQEIRVDPSCAAPDVKPQHPKQDLVPLSVEAEEKGPATKQRIQTEIGKDHRIAHIERPVGSASSHACRVGRSTEQASIAAPEVSHLGWGRWYTLRELEVATGMFSDENVIGEGGYAIVYRGVLEDNTQVAVKNLLNNRYVAPEYASTGMLNERSDVYSFGILIMETISGRNPVDRLSLSNGSRQWSPIVTLKGYWIPSCRRNLLQGP